MTDSRLARSKGANEATITAAGSTAEARFDFERIDDALGNAGHILVAAGLILLGLAVLAPLALLCLLAWRRPPALAASQSRACARRLADIDHIPVG